jgi:hypothetical protein
VFPVDKQALRQKFGTDKMERWNMYPREWKVLFVGALACGFGSLLLMWNHEKGREAREHHEADTNQPRPETQRVSTPESTPRLRSWKDQLLLPGVLLTVVGWVVLMIGMMWNKGARLLTFFSEGINPERGMRVFWIGAAIFVVGLGMLFLGLR